MECLHSVKKHYTQHKRNYKANYTYYKSNVKFLNGVYKKITDCQLNKVLKHFYSVAQIPNYNPGGNMRFNEHTVPL